MARTMPPMAALRVFEAAARHLNFTRAAEDLGMTQSAVSYQIKVLEDRVGAPLFIRRARDVALTDAGRLLAAAATDAFDTIADGFAAARGTADGVLVITVMTTFAANWLAERIGGFQMAHPTLAVRLEVGDRLVDFSRETADVGIRSGGGGWPGLESHMLLPVRFAPMASPKLLARHPPLTGPADLARLPIIAPNDHWWPLWFTGIGLPHLTALAGGRTVFHQQIVEARAALAGHGVAILVPEFFGEELASGRLVQLFGVVDGSEGEGYWLCYPQARRNTPKVRAFRNWILAELSKAGDDAGAVP